ncbi:MAG: hypothetical protein ACKOXO_07130 [Cyanobium sp.]
MPLDPRSRERLAALGRSLPQPLPTPEPPPRSKAAAEAPRHAVETEEDPEQLFRELMAASPDGRVPPHLLDRLRQLEKGRQQQRPAASTAAPRGKSPVRAAAPSSSPDLELYEAFEDLLRLADDHDSDEALPARGGPAPQDRLKPRPAERPRRLEDR